MNRLHSNQRIVQTKGGDSTRPAWSVLLILTLAMLAPCFSGCLFVSYSNPPQRSKCPGPAPARLLPSSIVPQPAVETEPVPARQQQGMEPQG